VDRPPVVTERHRAHFARIAEGNREMEMARLREVMRMTPGERIARAISLSDSFLQGRPSPEREPLPTLAARWRAHRDGTRHA
jgi:hypothetical protein